MLGSVKVGPQVELVVGLGDANHFRQVARLESRLESQRIVHLKIKDMRQYVTSTGNRPPTKIKHGFET